MYACLKKILRVIIPFIATEYLRFLTGYKQDSDYRNSPPTLYILAVIAVVIVMVIERPVQGEN